MRGDYNFNWDPEAVRVALESGAPLRIGTVEVIERATLTAADVPRLRAGDAACRAAAAQLAQHFAHRRRDSTSMDDPLPLTLAYTEDYLRTRRARLRVQTSAEKAWLRGWTKPPPRPSRRRAGTRPAVSAPW